MFPTTSTHSYAVTIAPNSTLQYSVTELNHRIKRYLRTESPDDDRWHLSVTNIGNPIVYGLHQFVTTKSNLTWRQHAAMECLAAYNTRFPSHVGNIILVMPRNDSVEIYHSFKVDISERTTLWLDSPHHGFDISAQNLRMRGGDPSNPTARHRQTGNWAFEGKTVQWCLVEERIEECILQFSTAILSTVIICNALKAVAMLAVFLLSTPTPSSAPLITVGDAVQSFLVDPDQYTSGLCYTDRCSDPYVNTAHSSMGR